MIVLELITGALRRAGVIGEAEDPSAEEGADAVTRLNDMMAGMAEDDIDLGWNPKSSTADTVVLPLGHVGTIKSMLAVLLADEYGTEVSQVTAMEAKDGYQRLLRQAIKATMSAKRSDAPRGQMIGGTYRILTDN
jgi:hypothetical protein